MTLPIDPLPCRLNASGKDTMDFLGVQSVSYRLDGILHVGDDGITLEWTGTRTTEEVSLTRVATEVDELPLEWLEMPMEQLTGATVLGGWWWPRLELRARALADFVDVPGARGVTLPLYIQRRDRALARRVAREITIRAARALRALDTHPRLGPRDIP